MYQAVVDVTTMQLDKSEGEDDIRVCILGNSGVGKSTFGNKLLGEHRF